MRPARYRPPTRGALDIMRDNANLQIGYQYLAFWVAFFRLIITALYTALDIKPNLSTEPYLKIFMSNFTLPIVLLLISYILKKVNAPIYSNTPQRVLISPGYDLYRRGGFGENLLFITMTIALANLLSLFNDTFWYILLLLPLRGVYLFWKLFLCPFLIKIFTDPEPENREKNKKKNKKKRKKKIKYSRTITHWHNFK